MRERHEKKSGGGAGRFWLNLRRRLLIRLSFPRLIGKPASNAELRERVLTVFLVVSLAAILVFIPINLVLDPTGILSLWDVLAGIITTINLYYLRRRRNLRVSTFIAVSTFALLILVAGLRAGSLYFFWSLIIPPVIYFLLGTRWGTIACLLHGTVICLAVYAFAEAGRDSYLLFHLPLSFATFSILGYFGERVRESYEERMAELSTKDSLTGLMNRRHMQDVARLEIQKSRRYGRPLSFLIFDIDHFKQVNDRLGHQAGDGVLRAVARTVARSLRDSDCFARWGGEEFLILAPETDRADLEKLADRLRRITAGNCFAQDAPITISLGGTTLSPGDTLTNALARADRALYRAKHAGRNAARFEQVAPQKRKRR